MLVLKEVKATEARSHFNELINRVRYGNEHIVITLHNQEAAVLISPQEYAELLKLKESQSFRYDFTDVAGKLEWQGDALDIQKQLRDDW